ncbi:hypothetical protein FACS1894121_1040 [Bacteroidia bacterium]|nr:hypothetical protein FACS1894121_1040 [Bacteroidia bacterium]
MKKLLLIILFFCGLNLAYAQQESGFLLGANVAYTFTTGDFKALNKNGIGVNLSGKYLINRVLGIGFESGYHPYKSKIGDGQSVSQSMENSVIPFLAEATFYYPTWDRTLLPYFGIHFGGYLVRTKISQTGDGLVTGFTKTLNNFTFGGGPDIGVLIEVTESIKLDLKLKGDYIPKIESRYTYKSASYGGDEQTYDGNIGFTKMLDFGCSVGLLYVF